MVLNPLHVQILPSILAADFARLGDEIAAVEEAGATMIHLDVMDGHFVPNISIGPPVVKSIRKATRLRLDVHLMITDPDRYIPAFIESGADQISVHQEACNHLDRTLRLIQTEGAIAGAVLNPATPVSTLEDVLGVADFVLLMSVNPGFGGQEFLPQTLEKVRRLRALSADLPIEIDGGITNRNVDAAARAGCNWIVAGSSIFQSSSAAVAFREMQQIASEALAIQV